MTARCRLGALLTLIAFGAAACASDPFEVAECKPKAAVVALFDISPSTDDEAIRQRYSEAFSAVVEGSEGEWQIAADLIDDNPLAHSTFPVNDCLPAREGGEQELTYQDRLAKARRDIEAGAAQILETPAKSGTAIMDGVSLAQRFFETYPEITERYLVICSDMVESSARYGFGKKVKWSAKKIDQIIAAEREAGRLPTLDGVKVYVVGAGADAAGDVSADKIRFIRDFWLAYFEAAGADLPSSRYGAALIRFP